MSDVSNLEAAEKWRFRGQKVPVVKGHSTRGLFVKRDDSVSEYAAPSNWESADGSIDSGDGYSGTLCCGVLRCVAVCCGVLRCGAVCCSVMR